MELAGSWGHVPIIQDLLSLGADINAGLETTALSEAVRSRNMALVKLYLSHGADPNLCATNGRTPLQMAIEIGDDDMIRELLLAGADPTSGFTFFTALEKNQAALDILFSRGFNRLPSRNRGFGGELLVWAIYENDSSLNRMLEAGFDINAFGENAFKNLTALGAAIIHHKGSELALVSKLLNHGGNPNSIVQAKPRETALMTAIRTRSERMVSLLSLLISREADVNRPAKKGVKRTPLQLACEIGSFKMVQLLLENGALPNDEPADRSGATALQLAAISGSVKITQELLDRGADVHAQPAKVSGQTALEGATEHGCLEIIHVLCNASQFPVRQAEIARDITQRKGHRGCAEFITFCLSKSVPSLIGM